MTILLESWPRQRPNVLIDRIPTAEKTPKEAQRCLVMTAIMLSFYCSVEVAGNGRAKSESCVMYEREKLERAKQRVADITAFYFHALVYAVCVPLMFAVNYHSSPEWWAQFPMLIWGFGLLAHACGVFGTMPRSIERWQIRKIKKIIEDR